jgi:hypothetical protein
MNKSIKMGLSLTALLSVAGAGWLYSSSIHKADDHVHYHAGFTVYIDGVKQDYSDYKYMNFVPCSEHDQKKSKAEEQIEKAHLHDGVGDVVHVHRSGGKWRDLFKNIGVDLPGDLPILDQPIEPDSSVVITVGTPVENPDKVTLEHIKEVEAKSELCGAN